MALTYKQLKEQGGSYHKEKKEKKPYDDLKASSQNYLESYRTHLKSNIRFDTFEDDFNATNSMLNGIYGGWQSAETMRNTRSKVEGMYNRLLNYEDYRKKYGDENWTDLSEYTTKYKSALDDLDTLSEQYSNFNSADEYSAAVESSRKKAEENAAYEKKMREANLLEEESELVYMESILRTAKIKKTDADSKEDDYIDNMDATDYTDTTRSKGRAGASRRNNSEYRNYMNSIGYNSIEELEAAIAEKKSFIKDASVFQEENKVLKAEDFEEMVERGWNFGSSEAMETAGIKARGSYTAEQNTDMQRFGNPLIYLTEPDRFLTGTQHEKEFDADYTQTEAEYFGKNMLTFSENKFFDGLLPNGMINNDEFNYFLQMTDDEKNIFTYLYMKDIDNGVKKYSESNAKKYYDSIIPRLKERYESERIVGIDKFAHEHPIFSSVVSVGYSIAGGFEYIGDSINYARTGEMDDNFYARASSTIRSRVSHDVDWEIAGWDAFDFLYNTGMSAIDSAAAMAIGGNAGGVLLGLSAAGQGVNDALDRGLSDKQAFWNGFMSGCFEMAFESVSIGNFKAFKDMSVDGWKTAFKNLGKTMLVNASEETFTELANIAYDTIAHGDLSQYQIRVQEILDANPNMSEAEAKHKAALEFGGRVLESGASGLLMGFGFGTTGNISAAVNTHQIGKSITANDNAGKVFDMAQISPEAKTAYEAYNRYAGKGVTAENASVQQVGALALDLKNDALKTLNDRNSTEAEKAQARQMLSDLEAYGQNSSISRFGKNKVTELFGDKKKTMALIDNALTKGEGTEAYKLATEYKAKIDSGKKLTEKELTKLVDATTSEVRSTAKINAENKLSELGEAENASELANIISKAAVGQRLSSAEIDAIRNNENASKVLSEMDKSSNVELMEASEDLYEGNPDLFLENYDGGDIDSYRTSFELVSSLAKNNYDADFILEHRGTLAPRQVQNIYNKVITEPRAQQQRALDELVKKYEGKLVRKANIDDSIFNGAKGQKLWRNLTKRQKMAITFAKAFAKGAGINLKITYNGKYKSKAYNGYYDHATNTIVIDARAGFDKKYVGEDAIITTMSHELTHWMKKKSPELYAELSKKIFGVLEEATGKTEYDLITDELQKHPEMTDDQARDEIIARACEDLLKMSEEGRKIFNSLSESEQKTLKAKIKEIIQNLIDWVNELLGQYDSKSDEAKALRGIDGALQDILETWDKMLVSSVDVNAALEAEGSNAEAFRNNVVADNNIQHSFRDTANGLANDFLLPYNEELTGFINQRGDYIVDSFEKLKDIVNLAFDNPQKKATAYFGIIPTEILGKIEKSIPNIPKELNGTLFKTGKDYSVAVTLDSIRHLADEKSLTRDDIIDYLDRMADTIVEFDTVHFDYYYEKGNKMNGLLFKKAFEDGTLTSFEIVSHKKRSLNLQTFYMQKGDYKKKKSAETTLLEGNPTADVQDEDRSNFNDSILNSHEKNNKQIVNNDGVQFSEKDNENLVEVEIDLSDNNELSNRIAGLQGAKKYNTIRDYIIESVGENEFVLSDGIKAKVDKSDALHIANKSANRKTAYISKINELIKKATLYSVATNVVHNKFSEFRYYKANVKFGDEIYPIYLNIGKAKNGDGYHLYDITKKIGDFAKHKDALERVNKDLRSEIESPNNIIRNSPEKNNKQNVNNDGVQFSEKDYPIDTKIQNQVNDAITKSTNEMHTISEITQAQNNAINRLVNTAKNDSFRGKYTGGKHKLSDNAIRHIISEHGDFLREALRAQLPMTPNDIARHLSAVKDNKYPSNITPSRTRQGNASIITAYEVNGYTLYAEEITKSLGQNTPSDLIGHTMYKAPTLSTAAFYATSAQTQPKRQDMVLRSYYTTDSTDLSRGNFVSNTNGEPVLLTYIMKNGIPKQNESISGLIALSSHKANFTDKSKSFGQGYVICKKPFYITADNRVFSNSETNVAEKINELKKQGYDCFIFDKAVGDNYMIAVVNKAQIISDEATIVNDENVQFSRKDDARITADMSDTERYEILKDKKIVDIPSVADIPKKVLSNIEKDLTTDNISSWEDVNKYFGNEKRTLIQKIASEFGVFKDYRNTDISLDFQFSKNNFRESYGKQKKNYDSYAKMFSVFDDVIDKAIGIEVHNRNDEGYKPDITLNNVYVMVSAFKDGDLIYPVKLEVKEFKDKQNSLYVAISLEAIKMTEVSKQGTTENSVAQNSRSVTISIHDIFKNVNSRDKDFVKYIPSQFRNEDVQYSERDNGISAYDIMGEHKALEKRYNKLKIDFDNLKELLKIEKSLTNGKIMQKSQLEAAARFLVKYGDSNYNVFELAKMLNDLYVDVQDGAMDDSMTWDEMYAKAYEVAKAIRSEAKVKIERPALYDRILKDIRSARIAPNLEQKGDAKHRFGDHYIGKFRGRVIIANDGTPLDEKWSEWSAEYPSVFDKDISPAQQLVELYDIYDDLRNAGDVVKDYEESEMLHYLATEIVNKAWTVAKFESTADKYEKRIKELNAEHRKAMDELKSDFEKKIAEQKLADDMHYGKILNDLRTKSQADVASAKQAGRERLARYRENVERNGIIKTITNNSLKLNKMLLDNSKDSHIPEAMKDTVIDLLQAIDFSSTRLLKGGKPTIKDISLGKKLHNLQNEMLIGNKDDDNLANIFEDMYGSGIDETLAELIVSVDKIMDTIGDDSVFTLNAMSVDDLKKLDKIVKIIKRTVNKANEYHVARAGASARMHGTDTINDLEKRTKIYDDNKHHFDKLKTKLYWNNLNPYYAFKNLGGSAQAIFTAFQDGQDKLAFLAKEVIDFTESLYTAKEYKKWYETSFDFSIPQLSGKTAIFSLNVPQIMSLYCVIKQEDAKKHILYGNENGEGGGITITETKEKRAVRKNIRLTEDDLNNIISKLDDTNTVGNAKEVADRLQEYMGTRGAELGNEITMARWGIKSFGVENYFPIKVSEGSVPAKGEVPGAQSMRMLELLNASFTHSRNHMSKKSVEIGDIFDVFSSHMSDMIRYNSLALPILDMYKWINFKGVSEAGEEFSLQTSVKEAFGDHAWGYLQTFLRDVSGSSKSDTRDNLAVRFFKNAKVSKVANNIKVAALQFTAFIRAGAVMDNKYLLHALHHKPKIKKAEEYCGIALWKSLGYYDTDITNPLTEKIKHAQGTYGKLVEWSLKGAEMGDKITWGVLWNACELEIRDTRKDLKVGSEEYFEAVGLRLRDVVYRTQVVDSMLTRSQMMRSKGGWDKLLTTFASEPTLSLNLVTDIFISTQLESREVGLKQAIHNNGKYFRKAITAYIATNAVTAFMEAVNAALKGYDDDDDEDAFWKAVLENFAANQSLITKIPYINVFTSAIQGFDPSRLDVDWMMNLVKAGQEIDKLLSGKGKPEKLLTYALKAGSDASGLAVYNLYRELEMVLKWFNSEED